MSEQLWELENNFVSIKEVEKYEREAQKYKKAINKALSLVYDAKNRYIKEKTRAKNKKAAEERDAVLNSPRFKALEMYSSRRDIQDSYGCACITESEYDRLQALWDEREEIKNHVGEDGKYHDLVTQALEEARTTILCLWEDEISKAERLRTEYEKQMERAEREYWKSVNNES